MARIKIVYEVFILILVLTALGSVFHRVDEPLYTIWALSLIAAAITVAAMYFSSSRFMAYSVLLAIATAVALVSRLASIPVLNPVFVLATLPLVVVGGIQFHRFAVKKFTP